MKIYGRFWVKKDSKNYLGLGKVGLLKRILEYGSISSAAKDMRMSYKAAWDDVDSMNNLSSSPLVSSSTGGRGGGGTKITKQGELAIEAFNELEKAKIAFCNYFDNIQTLDDLKNKAIELQEKIK
ncbi:winged helix-turn-helix domain-containing protein [Helicobacter sp. MIT 99-5507]|uniref:winged helix-turn-helix domain-containing protein n=1 Tax=Helicobacter sp. MIT 99-5507 TaxID=152489 RepID=UPI000E1F4243|nr:LysR family transcriptional regulator [Helicobacter sp. MIT 99-5507]RDU57334.1 molybdenum-pterin-binding protein [Helicobacter sp. MIT 99-5507]